MSYQYKKICSIAKIADKIAAASAHINFVVEWDTPEKAFEFLREAHNAAKRVYKLCERYGVDFDRCVKVADEAGTFNRVFEYLYTHVPLNIETEEEGDIE